jgi:Ca2+/Na+ antiporter
MGSTGSGLGPDQQIQLRLWDTTRRTLESLDRSLSEIRSAYFIALGVTVAATTNILKDNLNTISHVDFLLVICLWLIIFLSIAFQCLDDHYDRYMKTASKVARDIETELNVNNIGITCKLDLCAKKSKSLHWLSDLSFYFFPGVAAAVGILYLTYRYLDLDLYFAITNVLAPFFTVFLFFMFTQQGSKGYEEELENNCSKNAS